VYDARISDVTSLPGSTSYYPRYPQFPARRHDSEDEVEDDEEEEDDDDKMKDVPPATLNSGMFENSYLYFIPVAT
jgi:hypothetical protein